MSKRVMITLGSDCVTGDDTIEPELLRQIIDDANRYHEIKKAIGGSLNFEDGWLSACHDGNDSWDDCLLEDANKEPYYQVKDENHNPRDWVGAMTKIHYKPGDE